MDILQINPDSYREVGGVTAHIRNISERLARNHDVTVYATNRGLRFPRYELRNGVLVERFNCYAPSDAYFFSLEMMLRLRSVKFDVVHAHGYHAFPFHYSVLAKCNRLVVTPHFHGVGHSPFRNSLVRLFRPFGKRILQKADKIIAVSQYEKSLIQRQFGFGSDRVVVIPNGVDFAEFSRVKKKKRDFKSVLYVGYLAAFKGAQYLVEALPRLREDTILEIVGNGPLKPFLEKRARELNVSEKVWFYHDLPRQELLQKYADADVFALLSMHEAYSIVVAEALASGTPCVVARTSALNEWVDSVTCFGMGCPINIGELAAQINRVTDNGVDRRAMRKWVGTKILDWDDVTAKTEEVYLE